MGYVFGPFFLVYSKASKDLLFDQEIFDLSKKAFTLTSSQKEIHLSKIFKDLWKNNICKINTRIFLWWIEYRIFLYDEQGWVVQRWCRIIIINIQSLIITTNHHISLQRSSIFVTLKNWNYLSILITIINKNYPLRQ